MQGRDKGSRYRVGTEVHYKICYRQDGNPLSRSRSCAVSNCNAQVECLRDEQESEGETPRSIRLR